MQGWIKLHRQIVLHPIWIENEPFDKRSAWVDLIMMANHDNNSFLLGTQMVEVERGSFITSKRKLAERWKWSNTKVDNFLKLLEKEKMITIKSDTKKTLVTIEKYEVYQDRDKPKTTLKLHRNVSGTSPKRTNKNEKNEKNEKKIDEEANEPGGNESTILENRFIQLRNRGLMLTHEDYQAIDQVLQVGVPLEKALYWLEECFAQYKPRYTGDSINSFKYCRKYILDKFHREKKNLPPKKTPDVDPFLQKMRQLEEEAKKSRGEASCQL